MAEFLITYDVEDSDPDPHKPLLVAAEKEGLLYVWKGENYVSRLPNTTLWGIFENIDGANEAFENAVKRAEKVIGIKIVVEKRATVEMATANVLSNVRKKPDPKWTRKTPFETSRLHQINDPLFK